MLYNSFGFIFVFLPLCLLIYFAVARLGARWANVALAAMSLVSAWWDWRNVPILLASIGLNYAIGLRLRIRPARWLLIFGITINLLALGFFKYVNFAIWNVSALTGRPMPLLAIALPLGISFFTFTQIAFLVDAFRGEASELDFPRYCLFVTFFPHLIAGPIVHHRELMPQFAGDRSKRWNRGNVHLGLAFFIVGLCKKVILADTLAPWANEVFGSAGPIGLIHGWRGALAYTMQLYFDFSGYSDMAIGLGLLFNVRLPDNFDAPYRAEGIADFWRRWHITLSRFLRDYLYIPLGGNRRGEPRRRLNLLITMLLGGLWHGAGWTYVAWGAYHGVLLSAERLRGKNRARLLPAPAARALTFVAVVIGWVFFRSVSLARAGTLLASMAGMHGLRASGPIALSRGQTTAQLGALLALIAFVNLAPTTKQWVEGKLLNPRRAILLGFLFFVALLFMRTALLSHRPSEFIYFQF